MAGWLLNYAGILLGWNAPAAPGPQVIALPLAPPGALGGIAPPGGPPLPPPPPAVPVHVAVHGMDIQAALQSREAVALRARAGVRAREGDRGHVLARHHPSLTDQQLRNRLTTGLDIDGDPAPANVSSRFSSEQVFVSTLRAVFARVDELLLQTGQYLQHNLAALAAAQAAVHAAMHAPAPLNGPAIGAAHQALAGARGDLMLAVRATQTSPGLFPVYFHPGRQRIELFETYAITKNHRGQIGVGFYGTKPRENQNVKGKVMTLYGNTVPLQGPAEHTLTVLQVTGQADRALARPHKARDWNLTTHYPTYATEESIDFRGDD